MANVKITDLPTYPAVNNPNLDAMEIVDNVSNISRQVTASNLTYGAGKTVLRAGSGVTIATDDLNRTITINSSSSGRDFSSVVSNWVGFGPSKNAYISPGVVNQAGIAIALVATSQPGILDNISVTLNGVTLPGSYTASGTFPNYMLVISPNDLLNSPAEIAPNVSVTLTIGTRFNLIATPLVNIQPVPFDTVLNASYAVDLLPYYTTTAAVNYSYTNASNITNFAGVVTPGGNASSASGTFADVAITGLRISGTAIGNGLNGAGQGSVNLGGVVPNVPTYVPAFYAQTATSTVPTFVTTSFQTPGAAAGSTITYPIAAALTQYNWIATNLPVARLMLVTPLGNIPFIPLITASQTLAEISLFVYGWTDLTVGQSSKLFITVS